MKFPIYTLDYYEGKFIILEIWNENDYKQQVNRVWNLRRLLPKCTTKDYTIQIRFRYRNEPYDLFDILITTIYKTLWINSFLYDSTIYYDDYDIIKQKFDILCNELEKINYNYDKHYLLDSIIKN